MSYNFQKQIDFLLEYACPSIKYLVYRDMLDTPVDEPFMVALQNEILAQSNTQKHLSAQHPDGWFGHELHGVDGMDCHIGGLLNLGIETSHPAIQKAVTALLTPEIASTHKNWFRGGAALDAEGRGGDRAIVANILAMTKAPRIFPFMRKNCLWLLSIWRRSWSITRLTIFLSEARTSDTTNQKPDSLVQTTLEFSPPRKAGVPRKI